MSATAVLLAYGPAPLVTAAIVNPLAKPAANGKGAVKVVVLPLVLIFEIATVTGTFWPETYVTW